MSTLSSAATRKLTKRTPLHVLPARGVAIKRSVHELVIGVDAATFAAAFDAVMSDPGGRFGLIDVRRRADRVGQPFTVGERFHGCVNLSRTATRWRQRAGLRPIAALLAALSRTRLGAWLEEAVMSDFAEIVDIDMKPAAGDPYRVIYRYLSGTPMAGSSTFLVEPIDRQRCRFRVVFEYQEIGGMAISVLHRFGVKVHDEVTAAQAERAAGRAHAAILSSTIQPAYVNP